ncbi:MAG TPA: RidA family protein [Gaiellaceae bacterium]|nr:RidA family protein [Gaiellaceae bacterium]
MRSRTSSRLGSSRWAESKIDSTSSGWSYPRRSSPPGNYELVKVHGGLAYVAGHGPFDGAKPIAQGVVGRDLTLEEGYQAARSTGLSMLASLKRELGELDRVTEWIRAVCYVYCEPGFAQNAAVTNGFSDLIVELWGEAGRHARSSPGQGRAPLNVPVIVDAIAAVV